MVKNMIKCPQLVSCPGLIWWWKNYEHVENAKYNEKYKNIDAFDNRKSVVLLFKKANGKECNTVDPCQWVHGKQNLSSGRIGWHLLVYKGWNLESAKVDMYL